MTTEKECMMLMLVPSVVAPLLTMLDYDGHLAAVTLVIGMWR